MNELLVASDFVRQIIYSLTAVLCAIFFSYAITPPVRVFAYIIGAIDIPLDSRRMHTKPTPRIGGLAIYISFVVASVIFCEMNSTLLAIWIGGAILVIMGILDDIYNLNAWLKLLVQIGVALIAILVFDIRIDHLTFFGNYVPLGNWTYVITLFWIVCLTNAVNLIDGLDGLACGIASITGTSMVCVMLLLGDYSSALVTMILVGSCVGFLPFNKHPAKMFMGDTGALFLGYTLSLISVHGLFKLHLVLSFVLPLIIFAVPLSDTIVSFFRRLFHGQAPFKADRKHLHHKLVDMGFTQGESVKILYAVSSLLGLCAVTCTDAMFESQKVVKAIIIGVFAVVVFLLNYLVMKKTSTRVLSGLTERGYQSVDKTDEENAEKVHVEHAEDGSIKIVEGAAEEKEPEETEDLSDETKKDK